MTVDSLAVNTIRLLCADAVQKANSGHPGMPMGMAPAAHVLFHKVMKFSPKHPKWPGRDRFVLSNGHGCTLLYSMLHLCGYKVSLSELKKFRQLNSKTPGHPEVGVTDGVEVTTGPLGQGISNGVGLAIAEAHLAATFNKPGFPLFNNHTFVFCGDGCLQEGVASEACSLAGHLRLNKLVLIYDDNKIQIDGETHLAFTENVQMRFQAYGWNTITVKNADTDLAAIQAAIVQAKQSDKPTLISIQTTIGFGSKKQGSEECHGAPLGAADLKAAKQRFGFNPAHSFVVPPAVYALYADKKQQGDALVAQWNALFAQYTEQFPKLAAELKRRLAGELPQDWMKALPVFKTTDKADATRNLSGVCLNKLAAVLPELMGGSADLTPSNKTALKGAVDFQHATPAGRYLRFGVREHAMAAIGNGLHAYGAVLPFTATFVNFLEYMFPAIRLAALSHHQQLFVLTHDSIYLGEDGPTHQPIEALAHCRATPNVTTVRPADGNETAGAYALAVLNKRGPTVFALSRQNLPQLPHSSIANVLKGAYVVEQQGGGKPELILVATGSEVSLALAAAKLLRVNKLKVRVVSMPCMEAFDRQPLSYRRSVLTPGATIIAIEALTPFGWSKYAHHVIGMSTFGASAPDKVLAKTFGFTADAVSERVSKFLRDAAAQARDCSVSFPSLLPTHFTAYPPARL